MPDVTMESNALIAGFIEDALAKEFGQDPALDEATSRLISVYSSLIRRDGYVVQHAVERALLRAGHIAVWQEPDFEVSWAADQIATQDGMETCLSTELPYGIDTRRRLSRDLIVVDENASVVGSYDVKRGSGPVDSGKRRQLLRDTLCTQMLLKDYARQKGYDVDRAEARVISIYGRTGLPAEITINGDQLNAHFGTEIEAGIRESAEQFRAELARVMPRLGFRRV